MSMNYKKIIAPLTAWYAANARELPWRSDPTPYRVWISEIMLQQTRVEAVKPYFERFLRELPDVNALAAVPEERLLKLWEGLGYYSRARSLKKAAQILVNERGGVFPETAADWKKLPGVGDYTAGAVASIACGQPEPAVDGNVLRVAARLENSRRDVTLPAAKTELRETLRAVYPKENAGAFTQALMELGEEICLPNGAPLCANCPLSSLCEAKRAGTQAELPVLKPKPARRVEQRTVFLLFCGDRVAVRRRPESGLLAGMWEFPNEAGLLSLDEAKATLRGWGAASVQPEQLPAAKHVFTHLEWRMTGWLARVDAEVTGFRFVSVPELHREYAVPTAFRAYLRAAKCCAMAQAGTACTADEAAV